MNKEEFLALMKFPAEWLQYNLYPEALFLGQLNEYQPGFEESAEHDRNGAFHWWLKRDPTKEQLLCLVRLTFLDPDQFMAEDVRGYIKQAKNFDNDVSELINNLARNL